MNAKEWDALPDRTVVIVRMKKDTEGGVDDNCEVTVEALGDYIQVPLSDIVDPGEEEERAAQIRRTYPQCERDSELVSVAYGDLRWLLKAVSFSPSPPPCKRCAEGENCPFCGSDDLGIGCGTEGREGFNVYIYCGECGAQGPWIDTRDKTVFVCTAAAMEATGWKKRHTSFPPPCERCVEMKRAHDEKARMLEASIAIDNEPCPRCAEVRELSRIRPSWSVEKQQNQLYKIFQLLHLPAAQEEKTKGDEKEPS